MPTRYVGPGGNDGNSGLTWALRKLTLNGVEDTPVVAGDLVYIGPGVYRETLTVDVSGGGGSPIVYVGDITGEHTDEIGGTVRVTGSDNDEVAVRDYCVEADGQDYRTFRGIRFDTTISMNWYCIGSPSYWWVEDCSFMNAHNAMAALIWIFGQSYWWQIKRCFFMGSPHTNGSCIYIDTDFSFDTGHLIKNCLLLPHADSNGITLNRAQDVDIRNCTILSANRGIDASAVINVGEVTVENCIIANCRYALYGGAGVPNTITEDFNNLFNNRDDRIFTAVGANSVDYPPLFVSPPLHAGAEQISGIQQPWWFGTLSEWSQVRAKTGGAPAVGLDLLGIQRPATPAIRSWGCLQRPDMERDTGTVHTGTASMVFHDAGRWQMWVPISAVDTTISVFVYREANYAGVLPQMIIKQPGQADRITTDGGIVGVWNTLTDTFTPVASPPYVIVELVSRNTGVAGNYKTFFDVLRVT